MVYPSQVIELAQKTEYSGREGQYHLPWWWVKSFDATRIRLSPIQQIVETGLTPTFNSTELGILVILLPSFQQAIFEGADLTLNAAELKKLLPSQSTTVQAAFENLAHLLHTAELLVQNDGSTFGSVKWFGQSGYSMDGANLNISLRPTEMGEELLLGFYEPYSDMLRLKERAIPQLAFWPGNAPLTVSEPVWLEFSEPQRRFLLELEKAVQWQDGWVRLDGVFSLPAEQLIGSIKKKEGSQFGAMLKVMHQIGNKMYLHGLIDKGVTPDYMAFGKISQCAVSVAWQVPWSRIYLEEYRQYKDKAVRFLAEKRLLPRLDEITRTLSGPLVTEDLIQRVKQLVINLQTEDPALLLSTLPIGPQCATYFSLAAFLEIHLRALPGHPYPIDDWLRTSDLGAVISVSARDLTSGFKQFVEFMTSQSEFCKAINTNSSLVPLSLEGDARAKLFLEQSHVMPKVSLVKPTPQSHPEELKAKGRMLAGDRGQAKMRQAVLEELDAMRKNQIKKYIDLKRRYLESLDQQSRNIIIEVQQRLDASAFDEQIRSSLAKFLMENRDSPITLP
jgi:hypothetical protein